MGIALESTSLAECELATGRLVQSVLGRATDCRYVGHRLIDPAGHSGALTAFRDCIRAELALV